jgi:hypothetical protein
VSKTSLAQALHGFQKDAPPIHLDSTNPHFRSRFASLPSVVEAIRPALNKHGLVYMQFPTNLDGAPALETMLIHAESGEDIAAVMPLVLTKNDPQGYGSALTYARRYALLSILGLVGDEDDDANKATSVASRDEVPARNGQVGGDGASDRGKPSPPIDDPHGLQASRADAATDKQKSMIRRLAKELKLEPGSVDSLSKSQASARIEELLAAKEHEKDAVAIGGGPGAPNDDDIPFGASWF